MCLKNNIFTVSKDTEDDVISVMCKNNTWQHMMFDKPISTRKSPCLRPPAINQFSQRDISPQETPLGLGKHKGQTICILSLHFFKTKTLTVGGKCPESSHGTQRNIRYYPNTWARHQPTTKPIKNKPTELGGSQCILGQKDVDLSPSLAWLQRSFSLESTEGDALGTPFDCILVPTVPFTLFWSLVDVQHDVSFFLLYADSDPGQSGKGLENLLKATTIRLKTEIPDQGYQNHTSSTIMWQSNGDVAVITVTWQQPFNMQLMTSANRKTVLNHEITDDISK
eukprot:Gb_05200 [translate_table: standard]